MEIRYDGPRQSIGIAGYGWHKRGEIRTYPDDFGHDLIATNPRSRFVEIPETEGKTVDGGEAVGSDQELILAASEAIAAGNVTKGGKPAVDAMEKILGRDITAADRDRAWAALAGQAEK